MTKEEFVNILSQNGIKAVYAEDGIPEVFVNSSNEFDLTHEKIKRIITADNHFCRSGIKLGKRRGAVVCRIVMECIE